jgi:large subunit ribosomal protein L12
VCKGQAIEYAYAALLLTESGEELNERNLRAVLEAANCAVSESRVKALVAALEGVDVDSVGPETVGEVDDEGSPGKSGEADADEHDEEGRSSEVSDGAPAEAATNPAGDDTTPEASGDESG